MKQLTILVDMDDTIELLLEAWVFWLNHRYGRAVEWQNIREWDMRRAFPGLTREQIFAPLAEGDFWKTVKPMDGAADALRWMLHCGHKVYIVTASHYKTIVPKVENILFQYFPFLRWENVIVTADKHMICGDLLFDDNPLNLESGSYFKVLVNCPHNLNYDAEAHGMIRMHSWQEAKSIIQKLSD